jgi:undecaprenyl-diphosphatase
MNALHAVILGLVEGATEFLPVSSTGHLILASALLRLPESEFLKTFEIAIQLGAIAAVAVAYPRRLFADVEAMKRVIAAFLPTAAVGFVLYKLIKGYLLGNPAVVVWALALGGVAILVFERWYGRRSAGRPAPIADVAAIPYGHAVLIGLAQSLAVVPGVSRSAASIVGGLALGVSRATIAEFSFLLAVPTIAAAAGYDLLKSGASVPPGGFGLLAIGALTAFAVALATIRLLMRHVSRRSFAAFGLYRIAAAAVFALIMYR